MAALDDEELKSATALTEALAPEPTELSPLPSTTVDTVQLLCQRGLTILQCREVGYALATAYQCKLAGFTPRDCQSGGFTAPDCQRAGYPLHECNDAEFPYCVPCSGRGVGGELSNKFNCHHCGGDGERALLSSRTTTVRFFAPWAP
jgi:hypothetical protein